MDPITTGKKRFEDAPVEANIRPQTLDEYVGQGQVIGNIKISIKAAMRRGEALDHVLLYGPPGLGKTTLARIIAAEMGVNIKTISGPAFERAGDLAAILTNLQDKDVLFIDEIHRLNRIVEEHLYPAMEDYKLDIIIGEGPSARTVKINLPHFTLIGATTRAGLLTSPLRDRFGMVHRLEYYSVDDLLKIIRRSAAVFNIEIDEAGTVEIARRSRGTPRVANRLLKNVRDFAQVEGDGRINKQISDQALRLLEVDANGLNKMDRRILRCIIENFGGGPVGVDSIAATLSEETDTINDVYEPFLIQSGFLHRSPRGRIATPKAYELFGIVPPRDANGAQEQLSF